MNLIILALANATIVITLTKSSLFEKFRNMIPFTCIRKLFHCPYCLSHWTSALIIIPYYYSLFDFIISVLVLNTLTSFAAFILLLYLKTLDNK